MMLGSKGEILRYRIENLIFLLLLNIRFKKSFKYHPYVYADVFKMIYGSFETSKI